MKTSYLSFEMLDAYAISFKLSNYIWAIVISWNYFEKVTVGKQFTRAVDSISANMVEGFGRFSKKDKIRFYYYSPGSVSECNDWNNKCLERLIINKVHPLYINLRLNKLPKEIYQLINYTNDKFKY